MRRNSLMHYAVFGLCVTAALAGIFLLGSHGAVEAAVYGAATVVAWPLTQDNNDQTRAYPVDTHGKLRVAYFKYTNDTGAALADGTQIDLCDLPFGRVRILGALSKVKVSALGAARTIAVGHREYYDRSTPSNADAVVEDNDALLTADTVAVAGGSVALKVADVKFDLYSRAGVRLFATVAGDTIPTNAVIEGYVVYVTE